MKNSPLFIRINKYISNSGVCSRRQADVLIETGCITVNDQKITEVGCKISPNDIVKYNGKILKAEKPVYVLLNKPKDYITTVTDPNDRKTVLHLIGNAFQERIYPVGRLDRNTTGLLMLTNDGEVAKKLTHPSSKIRKIYHVELSSPITDADFEKIKLGVTLEDGVAHVDSLEIVDDDKKNIGIEIHMGKNRIVRRIFEHLKYEVVKLDRVVYGNLTKKNLPRGTWRVLTPWEVQKIKTL